jgi:hypothetical protein
MKVKANVKAGQIVVALIGQATGKGDTNNQGGAIGILNTVSPAMK